MVSWSVSSGESRQEANAKKALADLKESNAKPILPLPEPQYHLESVYEDYNQREIARWK